MSGIWRHFNIKDEDKFILLRFEQFSKTPRWIDNVFLLIEIVLLSLNDALFTGKQVTVLFN